MNRSCAWCGTPIAAGWACTGRCYNLYVDKHRALPASALYACPDASVPVPSARAALAAQRDISAQTKAAARQCSLVLGEPKPYRRRIPVVITTDDVGITIARDKRLPKPFDPGALRVFRVMRWIFSAQSAWIWVVFSRLVVQDWTVIIVPVIVTGLTVVTWSVSLAHRPPPPEGLRARGFIVHHRSG